MAETNNNQQIIDLRKVFSTLWAKRKVFYIMWPIVFALACIWIFPQPRYYTASVKLAPEGNVADVGGLAGIASSFGLNLGGMVGNDAIAPTLYPDLFESPEFLVGLFDIQVRTADGTVTTDYYTWRKDYRKHNPYTWPFKKAKGWLKNKISPAVEAASIGTNEPSSINPFCMSQLDQDRMMAIAKDITCSVDKQTSVITIKVEDQDRLVCALMADSVKAHLQNFITTYRTQKVREDAAYYQNLLIQSEQDYRNALRAYSDYADSHSNITRQSQQSEMNRLKNEMDLKLSAYNAIKTQLAAAEAKVQERTPAFTTLKSATVPTLAAGPKRMLFMIGMLILSTIIASLWLTRKELFG